MPIPSTAHPTYKQVGLTDVVGLMHCRSDGYIKNSIWCIQPTLSCSLDTLVGLMGLFHRSDGLFSTLETRDVACPVPLGRDRSS